jgi:hypothetical protein
MSPLGGSETTLDGFVEKDFGLDSLRSLQGGYVSFIVKLMSFIVLRLKAKPTSETDT